MSIERKLRVCVLIPANNTTVELELPLWLPKQASLHVLRIPRGKGLLTADTLPAYTGAALDLARTVSADDFDVVAYACTAASFILGPEGDRALAEELGVITGLPVVTIAHSMIAGLVESGAKRAALITPYSKAVNDKLTSFINSAGLQVCAFDSFQTATTDELARITADEVADLARKTLSRDSEIMFIACAQLPTFAILPQLAGEFGLPVLSSIQSLAAGIMQTAHGEVA